MEMKNDLKRKTENKKRLIRTKREKRNIAAIVTAGVLLVTVALFIFIDSRSYVATVAGNRIMTYEYKFLLKQQVITTEQEEGIYNKTNEERKQYWMKTEEGQNPWENAKNETLNAAKEYMIQLIKARELGISIDSKMKSEVNQAINNFAVENEFQGVDAAFANHVKDATGVTLDQFRKILENGKLIERFKSEYIKNNYKPVELTDEQIKDHYEENTEFFDRADINYLYLTKLGSDLNELTAEEIAQKKAKAEEALEKIQSGEDIEQVIKDYTEETVSEGQDETSLGKATVTYSESELMDFVFNSEIGESKLLETETAFYVVKVNDRTGFEDVKDTVETYMGEFEKEKFYSEAIREWSVNTTYNILKNDTVYDSIRYATIFPE